MKNKLVPVFFVIAFFLIGTRSALAACGDSITGGSGTVGSPYLISDPTELAAISNCLGAGNASKYFRLDSNIDLNVSPYNTGTGWTPIGPASGTAFYGKFDGDFYTISNLYFNNSASNYAGLFGYVASGATISDLSLNNAVVSGNYGVGALAGVSYGAVSKVGVTDGSVTGIQRVGGLIGSSYGSITQSYSDNTVYFNPTSSPTCCVGGLIGESYSGGSVNNSYSRSNIIMTYNVYNQGAAGGLYGNDYTSSTKTILYSTGSITMVSGSLPSNVGGLGGSNYTSTTSSYWDTEASGLSTSSGGAGVVGKTTAQMKTEGTYSGWDFDTIWAIDGVNNDGYPYLLWQDYADVTAPTVDTLSPLDSETTVGLNDNLVITFDETVVVGTGSITIFTALDDLEFEVIDVESGQVTGSGTTTITINPTGTFDELTEYYVQIDATAFDDSSSNSFTGIADETTWNFTTVDATAPSVSTFSPLDDAVEVSPTNDLVITFDEAVVTGTGNVAIQKTSDDSLVELIDVAGGQVTGSGTTIITINPSVTLADSTQYYVSIDATAFEDSSANLFAGISDTTVWSFTTNDLNAPVIDSRSPNDGASGVAVDVNIEIYFNEPVVATGGEVTLYYTLNNEYLYGFPTDGGAVSGSGTDTITINPGSDLTAGRNYYILIDANAFEDTSGNAFPEISSTTAWNFSTISSGSGKVSANPESATLAENGASQVVSVSLDEPIIVSEGDPTVVVTISTDDPRVLLSPDSLTFTDSDWNILQEFEITTVGDSEFNLDNEVTITLAVTSDSEYYNGYENTVAITLTDDDDGTPPDTFITLSSVGETSATFEFESNEVGSTFECQINDEGYAPCVSPYTTTELIPGDHTFYVRATDMSLNVDATPAEDLFTIEENEDAVGIWHLNESSGATAQDSSGNDNDGALTGSAGWTDGYLGNGFLFDGENDYFTIDRPVSSNFTICSWIKTSTAGNWVDHWYLAPIMDAEVGDIANDFGFGVDSNGHLAYGNGGAYDTTINGSTSVIDNQWHHACVTRNISTGDAIIYLDGEVEVSGETDTAVLNDSSNAYIGNGFDGAAYFRGLMDEILVYSRVLSGSEIEELYDSYPVPQTSTPSPGAVPLPIVLEQMNNINQQGQIKQTQPTAQSFTFTRTLRQGMSGDDVKQLQIFLNSQGFIISQTGPGSKGNESTYFGAKTKAALIKYQEAHAKDILTPLGLTKGSGLFGSSTMKWVNSLTF